MHSYGSHLENIYLSCQSSRYRLLILLTVGIATFLLVTLLSLFGAASNRTSGSLISYNKLLSRTHVFPSDMTLVDEWQTIKVKALKSKDSWSVSEAGIVFRRQREWTVVDSLCLTNETLIPMTFITPGGSVTAYIYDVNDKITFHQTVMPLLTPILTLMVEDATLAFIDIGADVGVFSLAVASLGNPVVAVEPYRYNQPKLCHGIKDSDLVGRCYVVTNAIWDTRKMVKVTPGIRKKIYDYIITDQMNRKGNISVSVKLHHLLDEFPITRAGIRIGTHDNVTAVLTGADDFFQEVQVQFIQVSWYYVQSQRYDNFILKFMYGRGFQAYGYWTGFILLDKSKPKTWPDNVIFRREAKPGDNIRN